ncbi:hypothetical protein TraAM80_02454 [Trypanosoma rangeli]|uniref:Uncharacterized protein n=1 Tax=Trypanosoma rangeli TaxID=5698 RepID=A0A3R7M4K2_TRYRA|nr:uncharacterized protein TraAM80_02454 [Trypanosoma rangeli]RNF08909.1 hypothetical protein TraAM80_02454 [Trypanosoma rangeli]|eukprot:RNF08909.1 hypothetical protein TraAM80_02454 [Trypanosoma rangeli]
MGCVVAHLCLVAHFSVWKCVMLLVMVLNIVGEAGIYPVPRSIMQVCWGELHAECPTERLEKLRSERCRAWILAHYACEVFGGKQRVSRGYALQLHTCNP